MKKTIILCACFLLVGCAHVGNSITTPEGWKYKESITAIGGGNIEKASQSLGGTVKLYNPDGSLRAEVTLDSNQDATGMQSDAEALKAGIIGIGKLLTGSQ